MKRQTYLVHENDFLVKKLMRNESIYIFKTQNKKENQQNQEKNKISKSDLIVQMVFDFIFHVPFRFRNVLSMSPRQYCDDSSQSFLYSCGIYKSGFLDSGDQLDS